MKINRGNNENNSRNLKVNKFNFNKHNDNNLDKNNIYLIGLIEKVLKV